MSDAPDLATWLRAQVDEDVALAAAAPHGPWVWRALGEQGYPQRITNGAAILIAEMYSSPDHPATICEHVVRWDPERALREAASKRALIDLHTTGVNRYYDCRNYDHIEDWQHERAFCVFTESRYCEVCPVECVELPLLALPYAGRDGYLDEWRPR